MGSGEESSSGRVIGVIPARYASTRFPGKALVEIKGKPLVVHVLDRARAAERIDEVVVATDDERIAEAVREAGGEVALTSPDCPTGSDRAAEAIAGRTGEIIVNIQGDEPDIDPGVIDQCVEALIGAPDCGVSTVMVRILVREDFESPHVVKAVAGPDGLALYFSRSPIPSPARMEADAEKAPGFAWGMKHLGLYAFRRQVLLDFVQWPQTPLEKRERLEQLRLLENGVAIRIVEVEHDSIGIDTPDEMDAYTRSLAGS